jgi:hypothetical protein
VNKLTKVVDQTSGPGTLKKEFRWSTSNKLKTSWMDIADISKVILDACSELYVDFRYTLVAGGPMTINDIYVEFTQCEDADDKFLGYRPPLTVSEQGNISNLTKIENFTFKPYAVNAAVALYKELSYTINQMFGHEIMYARANPLYNGRDFTLHEWTLYDVDDPCCVKVLVPGNEFPDSKITFNPMGLDFEMPFEIHIVKDYYESIFGIGTGPQKRDIIYFPLVNRIYEIESSYLWRDIMQREVYWKVSLKKYQPKSNRYEPTDLREQFDNLTWDAEERFGEEVRQDEIKTTKPEQYDPKIGSRDYDPVRLNVNDDLVISQSIIQNYSIYLSESQYDLRSIFDVNANTFTDAVVYREKSVFTEDPSEERSLTGWFQELKPKVIIPKDPIKGTILIPPTTPPGQITFNIPVQNRDYEVGDVIKITRFNGFSLYGRFLSKVSTMNGLTITMAVHPTVLDFVANTYSGWHFQSGYIAEKSSETVLLDGYDESTASGWKFSLYASRYFVFKSTSEEYVFAIPNNVIEGSWYAFFLNVNNYYNQMALDVWIRKWNETEVTPIQTTDLENIYSKAIVANAVPRSAVGNNYNYRLPASNLLYTNIRLFNKTETDLMKQMTILNQTIVQDAQFAIIIDNAVPRLLLPWSGKTK